MDELPRQWGQKCGVQQNGVPPFGLVVATLYCRAIYSRLFLALLFILSLKEGDFHAFCNAHFNKIREQRPTVGYNSNRGIIDEFAPEKVAACKDILWHSIPEHYQWIVDFGLATSLYLRTEEVAKLTWSQVVLGTENHIVGLIGGCTVHITNIFDKTHKLSL
jgi:hypothetical protein